MGRRPFLVVVAFSLVVATLSALAALLLGRALSGCYLTVVALPDVPLCATSMWGAAWVPGALLALSLVVLVTGIGGGVRAATGQFRTAGRIERWLKTHSRLADSTSRVAQAAAAAGVTAPVHLCDVTAVAAVTIGVRSPRIYLAAALVRDDVPDDELVALLAHEQAHVQHRDPLLFGAVRAAALVAWPFPMVRQLADHVSVRAEVAADANAVSRAGEGPMLSLLYRIMTSVDDVPDGAVGSIAGDLEQRLRALQGRRISPSFTGRAVTASAFSLLVMSGVVAALLRAMAAAGWALP